MAVIETTPAMVEQVYAKTRKNIAIISQRLGRSLTLAEKILAGHMAKPEEQDLRREEAFLLLNPDRVAMQDATAQMAILQFMLSGRKESAVPATVHCDHLIIGKEGVDKDLPAALDYNSEVYNFLSSASSRYHIGFWKPGAGIIHQIVLENYAFPGGLMIGTDSHTPNAGGLGMIASGVGGADAADVMAGLDWEVKNPGIIGVKLTGKLSGWSSGKDVIIKLLEILTVKGGTNKIIEYFGEGCRTLSCTAKATVTNMGAELGATCSLFPYDEKMAEYLSITGRDGIKSLADANNDLLSADNDVLEAPEKFYDQVIEIDLSSLEPQITGPHSPDAVTSLSAMKEKIKAKGWPEELSAGLIGSCTNSSYEDIDRSVSLIRQALRKGLKFKKPFLVSPGSALVKETIKKNGLMDDLLASGSIILANACGPCIGQWDRVDMPKGETNAIINSFNRNFKARNDGNPETLSFIASPEIVTALTLAGRLDFNPETDSILSDDGKEIKLDPPKGDENPPNGFAAEGDVYQQPLGAEVEVMVDPSSERIQLLTPFSPWNGEDLVDLPLLCKAKGKCTTDHISPAGKWLRYRGHLENISDNMLSGAVNAFTGETGTGFNPVTGERDQPFSTIAKSYKSNGQSWVVIGDENYGEGSSREHAAMSPRFLGAAVVIVRSFARIHETNLKKQGVLALMFEDSADYDLIEESDSLSITGLTDFTPGKNLALTVKHKDGRTDSISLKHTFNDEQIEWFKAGSALNVLRNKS